MNTIQSVLCVTLLFSFIYLLTISITFICKKRINSPDTSLYEKLIMVNLVSLILELSLLGLSLTGIDNNEFMYSFFLTYSKVFVCFICSWFYLLKKYSRIVYYKRVKKSNEKIDLKKENILFLICCLIILLLPVEFIITEKGGYTTGPATKVAALVMIYQCLNMTYYLFKSRKNLRNKELIPIIMAVFGLIITIAVQMSAPYLLIFNPVITFITIVMYFTIENPDVKMLEQVNEAKIQADKANNAKTEFLSSMSHEIRTPLNAIVGFSNSLLEENVNEEAKTDIDNIIMASDSLLDIVNGILDISKIEANKLEIVKVNYSFPKIFNDLVMLTKARMGEKPLEFNYSYDKNIPEYLYGDVTRVKQVILNLLTNAVKYTNTGSIDFRVDCELFENTVKLNIVVKDTGIGVKKENLDKLFTKFDRLGVEKDTSVEGTGLGLAITKKLVNLMGGKITVESEYGKGSTFTISLSQKIVKGNELKELLEQKEEEHDEVIDVRNKKVLVVDDNKLNLKVAEKLLSKYNVCLDMAESGQECINKVRENKYDLILLDDMMPKMSGTETLKELKKINDFNIPTVALTANAISGMKEKYINDGFDDYLSKPIEKLELNRVIKKYLS